MEDAEIISRFWKNFRQNFIYIFVAVFNNEKGRRSFSAELEKPPVTQSYQRLLRLYAAPLLFAIAVPTGYTQQTNQAPTVNAGPAQTITLPSGATLSGSAVDDGLPNPPGTLTYQWTTMSGPGNASFADATAPTTTATFPGPGVYVLRLAAFDGELTGTGDVTITVNGVAPQITSAAGTTLTVGTAGSFTVTSTGIPTATLSETGSLPNGVTFVDNGDGTATLAGTPGAGTAGTYAITITASNGTAPDATQSFTLTVQPTPQAPQITSANSTTFTVGNNGSFTVTSVGSPTASVSETGALPSGVTFVDNQDGTATLSGTLAAGTAGSYPITITATNGVAPAATQSFTLTVKPPPQAPQITSANSANFTVGSSGSFVVSSTGSPTATLSESGALPSGITFVDNQDGTATLSGTPAANTVGSYPITITASNGVAPNATQNFTVNVQPAPQAPQITSASSTTFTIGTAGSFSVTSTGVPTSGLSATGSLPSGVTFVDNHDGTATLAGTPAAGTAGSYPITLTASNGVAPDATQSFTLNVQLAPQAPQITSANSTTFTVGSAGSFTVTSTGNPTATLSATGALPSGVTFVDNHDSTATLAGTPAVGTAGSYPITVGASNGVVPNATQNFTLTVSAANTAPVVNAGADQAISIWDTASLAGSAADDGLPSPSVLTYSWSVVSGPGTVSFGSGTSANTTATFSVPGIYTLRLTVSDGALSGSDDMVVTVGGLLPSPWVDGDIGAVGFAGRGSYLGGTFIERGSGADIWGTADAFHYIYQPLTGDGQIVVRVATQDNSNAWAKAGVMIRETLAPGSKHAAIVVTPGNGVSFQRRLSTNGTSALTQVKGTGIAAPYWVKLVRKGNVFTSYRSSDGVTWTGLPNATITMSNTVYIGLAVTSHNNSASSTATFDHIDLAPQVNAGP